MKKVSIQKKYLRIKKKKTYDGELIKWPGSLDILQSLLQVHQLGLDATLGLLGRLDGLSLKGIDGLELTSNVVGGRLEGLEVVLNLVNDGLVLEGLAVVRKVDGLGLLGQHGYFAAGVIVALLEGLEGCGGLAAKSQGAGDFGPVDFESGATLYGRKYGVSHGLIGIFALPLIRVVDGLTYWGSHCDGVVVMSGERTCNANLMLPGR